MSLFVLRIQLDNDAKSLGVLRGTLSRWLLPYDHNTRIDEQSSEVKAVMNNAPDSLKGKLNERRVHYLVQGANSVRKLVRIKIADDNDLDQAKTALITIVDFLKWLRQQAELASKTSYEFLRQRRDNVFA